MQEISETRSVALSHGRPDYEIVHNLATEKIIEIGVNICRIDMRNKVAMIRGYAVAKNLLLNRPCADELFTLKALRDKIP